MTREPRRVVLETTIDIHRSPADVFDYCSDPFHELEWNPKLQHIERTTDEPINLGARYEADFRWGGKMTIECVRYDRPHTWATVGDSPRLRGSLEGHVVPTRDGARVTFRMEIQPKGPLSLLSTLIRRRMRHAQEGHLTAIKTILETSHAHGHSNVSPPRVPAKLRGSYAADMHQARELGERHRDERQDEQLVPGDVARYTSPVQPRAGTPTSRSVVCGETVCSMWKICGRHLDHLGRFSRKGNRRFNAVSKLRADVSSYSDRRATCSRRPRTRRPGARRSRTRHRERA